MTFKEVLHEVVSWIEQDGSVSYRAIKRQFDDVDDEYLEDLKDAIVYAHPVALEERGFRWTGVENAKAQDVKAENLEVGQAERRRITVMFCDLADSTRLSQQLDPEDLREVIRAYQGAAAKVISQYDGYVAQYLGDGLLVYFGWPRAHENEAERAVLTGLEVIEAIKETLNPTLRKRFDVELNVRIGVHTGLVVVGQMGGEGRTENLATGDTVNIAARIEGMAAANTVAISEVTQKLVASAFDLRDLGAQNLKGVTEGTTVYEVLGKKEQRAAATGDEEITGPFLVGRDEEIGLLNRRWEQAKRKLGQVVLISGNAGIGKSGLVESLRAEVRRAGFPCVVIKCSSYHQNSAYYPLVRVLEGVVQFDPGDSDEANRKRLEQYFDSIDLPYENAIPAFCNLLLIEPGEAHSYYKSLTPQKQKQLTSDAIVSWLFKVAQQQAFLAIWEDLHWADPSTLEVVGYVVEQIPTVPMLSVFTYRPQFIPQWRQHSHITPIVLNRLELAQTKALICHLTNNDKLPDEVVDHIVEKTDGVPLFIEELTKMLLESGIMRKEDGEYKLTGPLDSLSIPDTLQDSLMARLDQLNTAKEVAQLGSVIGREFSYESISAIYNGPEARLHSALDELLTAELLYIRGRLPDSIYTFKHALLQDAAYDTLLKTKRQEIHLTIAKFIEAHRENIGSNQPELIAHHYTEGRDLHKGLEYWLLAGNRARLNSSNSEAIAHFNKGLEIVSKVEDPDARVNYELDLQLALGPALIATKGFAYHAVDKAYYRARELAEQVGDPEKMYAVLWGLLSHNVVLAKHHKAKQAGLDMADLPVENNAVLTILMDAALGIAQYSLSEFDEALSRTEQAVAKYKREHHDALVRLVGMNMGVFSRSVGCHCAWQLGKMDLALKRADESLVIAEDVDHPFSRSFSRAYAAMLHQYRRDIPRTQEMATSAIALTTEQQFPYYLAWAMIIQGWCLGIQGNHEGGLKLVDEGLVIFRNTGSYRCLPYYLSLQAEIQAAAGNLDQAIATLDRGLETADSIDEHWWGPELYRLKGEYLLADSEQNLDQVKGLYQSALDLSAKLEAKTQHLRAATSMAKLLAACGDVRGGVEVLKPVYGSFEEGFGSWDLLSSKAVLEELQGG